MASACSFHGVIGIQNATPYLLDSKKNAPPEDGIYFINVRIVTAAVEEKTMLELCCVDDMQSSDSGRVLPTVIVVGKVLKGSSEVKESHSFNVNIMQYGIMPQQLARI
ncbi:hypothetical protein BDR04DRAFT_1105649 [Suillus decipiens]|nr:hypothetical protein BDR04DRAFT_1105649 [Suillus decipiens]